MQDKPLETFAAFYPYYLSEHRSGACRVCHLLGSTSVLTLIALSATTGPWWLLLLLAPAGYGPAWIGHFVFEKNRPATFQYPKWSFIGDWVMMKDILTGRVPLLGELPERCYRAQATKNAA